MSKSYRLNHAILVVKNNNLHSLHSFCCPAPPPQQMKKKNTEISNSVTNPKASKIEKEKKEKSDNHILSTYFQLLSFRISDYQSPNPLSTIIQSIDEVRDLVLPVASGQDMIHDPSKLNVFLDRLSLSLQFCTSIEVFQLHGLLPRLQ
ncbi:hypothetical protein V8G54_017007 [Vigna mungo]|uniref:Uncharacterized protein n=1 Tax=Vigna mungo TaxID=3915 RepID=A0AAQ3NNP5_VIGMU